MFISCYFSLNSWTPCLVTHGMPRDRENKTILLILIPHHHYDMQNFNCQRNCMLSQNYVHFIYGRTVQYTRNIFPPKNNYTSVSFKIYMFDIAFQRKNGRLHIAGNNLRPTTMVKKKQEGPTYKGKVNGFQNSDLQRHRCRFSPVPSSLMAPILTIAFI